GHVPAAVITVFNWDKDIQVRHGSLSTLGVDDVASEDEDLIVKRDCRRREASGRTGHGAFLGPLAGGWIHFVSAGADRVPGFLWTDAHEGENFWSAFVMRNSDGIIRNRGWERAEVGFVGGLKAGQQKETEQRREQFGRC